MKKVANRLLLINLFFALSISYLCGQDHPTITSVQGKLIRVTPELGSIDRNSMYGLPLKKTRRGEGLLGVVDIERAEESIFKKQFPDRSANNRQSNITQDNNFLASI